MTGARERYAFAAGDLGFNFVWQSIELYLLYFYIAEVGLSPEAASGIFLVGALVDWFADPLIGILVDRLTPRIPVRAWVLFGGPAGGAALVAAFAEPGLDGAAAFRYALVVHVLLRACYSLGNIPYGALTTRISARPADHVALTGARMQGAALGGLIAAAIYALLPADHAHGADFKGGALLLVILAQPAFLATVLGVRERERGPLAAPAGAGRSAGAVVRLMLKSPPLRRLLAVVFAAGLSVTVVNKSILFLFSEIGRERLGYWAALAPSLSLLLSVPLWVRLARRRGRTRTLQGAALLNLAALLAIPLMLHHIAGVGVLIVAAVIAGSGMSVMFWALVPHVIARIETQWRGDACAGQVYALAGIARKLAQALAPQFVALSLTLSEGRSVAWGFVLVGLLTCAIIFRYAPADDAGGIADAPG